MRNSTFVAFALSLCLIFFGCAASKNVANSTKTQNTIPLIIDADTANEIDDLYAMVRALAAPELDVRGITAAQFHTSLLATDRSAEESHRMNQDIVRLMGSNDIPLHLGSNEPLIDEKTPQNSAAAQFIIKEAHKMPPGKKLQIAVLGPCTNVASALLLDPTIADRVEVSYIGFWHDQEKNEWDRMEFNSSNDQKAVNVLLDNANLEFNAMTATTSGNLKFDKAIAAQHLQGKGGIKDYLYDRWLDFDKWWHSDPTGKPQWTMWDVAIIEALIHPENAQSARFSIPSASSERNINAYTSIDVPAMKSSFWQAIDNIPDTESSDYLIKDVCILTMLDNVIKTHRDVHVRNGKIKQISHTGTLDIASSVPTILGQNRFLMPGLSEMHAHIPVPGDDVDEDHVKETLMLYLANGITIIRGMLGNPYHLELKKKVVSGKVIGPRIYTSSPSMNGISLKTSEDAIAKVTAAKEAGYDFLKIHPGIKLEVMETLVKTANQVGIKYAGHVPEDVGIERALNYGYESVDHVDGYVQGLVHPDADVDWDNIGFFGSNLVDAVDFDKMDKLAKLTRDKSVWLVPTQTLFTRWLSPIPAAEMMRAKEFEYLPSKTRFAWRTSKDRMNNNLNYDEETYSKFIELRQNIIKKLYAEGVGLLLGSDAPQVMNVPGFSIHHEIEAIRDAGIPIYEIIKSGTSNPAEFFDVTGLYGTIQVGADADFIIVEDNPLTSPETMKTPVGTMISGRWLDRAYFQRELEKLAAKHSD